MVGLVETLTVGLFEELRNLYLFYHDGKIRFPYFPKVYYQNIIGLSFKINPYDFEELVD